VIRAFGRLSLPFLLRCFDRMTPIGMAIQGLRCCRRSGSVRMNPKLAVRAFGLIFPSDRMAQASTQSAEAPTRCCAGFVFVEDRLGDAKNLQVAIHGRGCFGSSSDGGRHTAWVLTMTAPSWCCRRLAARRAHRASSASMSVMPQESPDRVPPSYVLLNRDFAPVRAISPSMSPLQYAGLCCICTSAALTICCKVIDSPRTRAEKCRAISRRAAQYPPDLSLNDLDDVRAIARSRGSTS